VIRRPLPFCQHDISFSYQFQKKKKKKKTFLSGSATVKEGPSAAGGQRYVRLACVKLGSRTAPRWGARPRQCPDVAYLPVCTLCTRDPQAGLLTLDSPLLSSYQTLCPPIPIQTPSASQFRAIFDAAVVEYTRKTRKDTDADLLTAKLPDLHIPQGRRDVPAVLREQARRVRTSFEMEVARSKS